MWLLFVILPGHAPKCFASGRIRALRAVQARFPEGTPWALYYAGVEGGWSDGTPGASERIRDPAGIPATVVL